MHSAEHSPRRAATFLAVGTFGGTFIRHDGLPEPLKDFAFSDLNELQAQGMIRLNGKSGSSTRFEISNDGWKYWEAHQETGVERIEAEVRRLLDPAANVGPYASAFARWKEAEAMLWQEGDGEHWVTEVGHVCREAMQAFAAAFFAEQGQAVTSGPSNTVDRIRAGPTRCASGCRRRTPRSTTRCSPIGHGERSRAATGTRSREGGRADRLGRREARRDADSDGDDRVDARERSRAMSDWWIRRSVEDLEAAVERGDVTETYHLDFKQFTHAHDEETKIRVLPGAVKSATDSR